MIFTYFAFLGMLVLSTAVVTVFSRNPAGLLDENPAWYAAFIIFVPILLTLIFNPYITVVIK